MSHQSSVIGHQKEYGFKNLLVWQKAMELAKDIYLLTKEFPKEEQFGLVSQMRRAAISIPSNIAEGSGRRTQKDFRHFLSIAYGSSMEIETQLILAKSLSFGSLGTYQKIETLLREIVRMLNKMVLKTDD